MPARHFLRLLGLIALLGLCPVKAQQVIASDSISDYRHRVELETFQLINAYRKAHDLAPLQWNLTIAEVARDHSRDMATGEVDFGHAGFHDRVTKLGGVMAGLRGAGENVFETSDPEQVAQSAVTTWLKSPPHLKNIRGDYNYSGLGVWQDKDGVIYFTQIFLKLEPKASTSQTAETAPPGLNTPFGFLAAPNTR